MDIKIFLYSWFAKRDQTPIVEIRAAGLKPRQRFLCEIKVKDFLYTGFGSSNDGIDAEINAAKDFIHYLIRQDVMNPSDIPSKILTSLGLLADQPSGSFPVENPPIGEITTPHDTNVEIVPAAGGSQLDEERQNESGCTEEDTKVELRKLMEETRQADLDPATHGNWTIENAKSKLHQFLQQHNLVSDYQYSSIETEGSTNFVAELSVYIRQIDGTVSGRGTGRNKMTASKNCALSLVHQLYHLGVIEAFTGSLKLSKEKKTKLKPFEVRMSPELENEILDVLNDLNIEPVRVDTVEETEEPISIINNTIIDGLDTSDPQPHRAVIWTPPTSNWNPWLSCNIDEEPFASMSLDDISTDMENQLRKRLQEEEVLNKVIKERDNLPIATCKKQIMDVINENSVCLIRGKTGCGKTTQVGQFILDDYIQTGQGAHCNIIVTQPKKISTLSTADRVAYERGESLGMSVGYSVRFESAYPRPHGSILYCTADTLLKKLENGLNGISHIIIDEIHQRDMNTDFILVLLRDMVNAYTDLRVILMSATMDTTAFSNYFSGCPTVEIPEQFFPVQEYFLDDTIELVKVFFLNELKWRRRKRKHFHDEEEEDFAADEDQENLDFKTEQDYPIETKDALSLLNENEINFDLIREILIYVKNQRINGAVLIFLPGWNIIFCLMRYLQRCTEFSSQNYVILPLHSHLSTEDQKRVFESVPPHVTKIILSTDLAESSITIDDVTVVIDSCRKKIKKFTRENNLTQCSTVWASKTNLEQRRGRVGRAGPGYCFHLCSKARYETMEEYIAPEMFRLPVYELALTVKFLGLGSIREFLCKALDPPPLDVIMDAELYLREMKYIDQNDELTPLGRMVGKLPIEPNLGKMVIMGTLFNCANPLATIAANSTTFSGLLSNMIEGRELNYQQKAFSGIYHSDHIATINAFQGWENAMKDGTDAGFCQSNELSEVSIISTADAKHQLLSILTDCLGFPKETLADQVFNFHGPDQNLDMFTALLAVGLYPNIAYHVTKRKLLTSGHKHSLINKKSVNCRNRDQGFPYPFFLYGEQVKTKAVSCKELTMVSPLSLLLFGARKVEYVKGIIKLDGWINLIMNPSVASSVVSLRPALDSLIMRVAKDPTQVMSLSLTDRKVIRVIRELCTLNAASFEMLVPEVSAFQSRGYNQDIDRPPSSKRMRLDYYRRGFRCRGGHHGRQTFDRGESFTRGFMATGNYSDSHPSNYGGPVGLPELGEPARRGNHTNFRSRRNHRNYRSFRNRRNFRGPINTERGELLYQ